MKTTSSMDPHDMIKEIKKVSLDKLNGSFLYNHFKLHITYNIIIHNVLLAI